MGVDRYEELTTAVYDAFNALDEATMDERFVPDFVEHADVPPGITPDLAGLKAWMRMMHGAFPDLRFDLLDMIAVEGKVCCRVRMTGTNTGEMMGMPPTGRAVDVEAFDYATISDDDRVTEHWGAFEEGKMMRQLGMIPEQQGPAEAATDRPAQV